MDSTLERPAGLEGVGDGMATFSIHAGSRSAGLNRHQYGRRPGRRMPAADHAEERRQRPVRTQQHPSFARFDAQVERPQTAAGDPHRRPELDRRHGRSG
jgi:hypothetical protein